MLGWKEMNERQQARHIERVREAALAVLPALTSPSLDDASGLAFNTVTTLVVEQAWVVGEAFARQEAMLWVKLEAKALAEEKDDRND